MIPRWWLHYIKQKSTKGGVIMYKMCQEFITKMWKSGLFHLQRLEDQVEKNAVFHTTAEKQTNIGSTCSLQRTKLLLFKGKKAAARNILNPQHRPFGGETDACPGHCAVEEGNRIITDVSFLCLHTSEWRQERVRWKSCLFFLFSWHSRSHRALNAIHLMWHHCELCRCLSHWSLLLLLDLGLLQFPSAVRRLAC